MRRLEDIIKQIREMPMVITTITCRTCLDWIAMNNASEDEVNITLLGYQRTHSGHDITVTVRAVPFDPACKRRPDEISEYIAAAIEEETTPDDYVIREEGTYNHKNGHFLCTSCYIDAGQPSELYPKRWVCP